MFTRLLRFLKLDHYDKLSPAIKKFSRLHLWFSCFFLLTPLYYNLAITYFFPYFFDSISIPKTLNIFAYVISAIIFINSSLNIYREHLLDRLISNINVVHFDVKKELIRHTLNFLIDNYGWRGTCRATVFVLSDDNERIIIYDRISVGLGVGNFIEGRTFFRNGQGIPGKAWQNAWMGDNEETLIGSFQFGNVSDNILREDNSLRRFFKETYNIVDNDIYDSLGPKKFLIRSYMAIGVLGKHHRLLYVLVLDSEDREKFADFETLQKIPKNEMMAEAGLMIMGEGKFDQIPDLPSKLKELMEVRKKLGEKSMEEVRERASEMSFLLTASHSKELRTHVPSFIYPLNVALRQIKEIFLLPL